MRGFYLNRKRLFPRMGVREQQRIYMSEFPIIVQDRTEGSDFPHHHTLVPIMLFPYAGKQSVP